MDNEWKMNINNYGVIRIPNMLTDKLTTYCQLNPHQPESGGVHIGKHLNSGGALLIDDFTPPQPSDKQQRCLNFRSKKHNEIVNEIWQDSKGHATYVGLWHTHPEPVPNFSATDKKDWLKALNTSRYEGNLLFFIIVGQTHIRCWVGIKHKAISKIGLLGEYKIEE